MQGVPLARTTVPSLMAQAPGRGQVPVPGRGQVREPGPALAVAPVQAELVLSVAPELVAVRWAAPERVAASRSAEPGLPVESRSAVLAPRVVSRSVEPGLPVES